MRFWRTSCGRTTRIALQREELLWAPVGSGIAPNFAVGKVDACLAGNRSDRGAAAKETTNVANSSRQRPARPTAGYENDPCANALAMRNTWTGSVSKTLSTDHVLSRTSQQSCVTRELARFSSFTSRICSGRPAMPTLIRLADTSAQKAPSMSVHCRRLCSPRSTNPTAQVPHESTQGVPIRQCVVRTRTIKLDSR